MFFRARRLPDELKTSNQKPRNASTDSPSTRSERVTTDP
jgi:hypothetical protein